MTLKAWVSLVTLAGMVSITGVAQAASPRAYANVGTEALVGDDRTSVNIGNDSGGYVVSYALRMFDLRDAGTKVRFTGRCDSACTLFLALPNNQTCVTPDAYFRFHAPSAPSAVGADAAETFMMRKYPAWVRSWIHSQGGLTGQLVTMDYHYASKYVRTCA